MYKDYNATVALHDGLKRGSPMRVTSWFLSFALMLILFDVGWERTRRERARQTAPEVGQAASLDDTNGQPPPPKP